MNPSADNQLVTTLVGTGRADVTVTVITPCYNGGSYLAEALRSALGQSRPPLEVIVVDDGSTDDSASIAERFGPPVRVIQQENQGLPEARNRGLAEARGTHVLFLDADDLLSPEALEHLVSAVGERPDAVALMGCGWFRSDPGQPYFVKPALHRSFFPDIIEGNLAPVHSWLVPRRLVEAAGRFHGPLRCYEDWDFWWRV